MKDIPLYLMAVVILIGVILRARTAYFERKLWKYIRENYPEKEKEFGRSKGGWFNEFALIRSLYKEYDLYDPEFVKLKNVTRQAWTALLVMIGSSVFIILLGSIVLILIRT